MPPGYRVPRINSLQANPDVIRDPDTFIQLPPFDLIVQSRRCVAPREPFNIGLVVGVSVLLVSRIGVPFILKVFSQFSRGGIAEDILAMNFQVTESE